MRSHVSASQKQTSHPAAPTLIVAFLGLAGLAFAGFWLHGRATGAELDSAVSFTKVFAARSASESVANAVSEPSARTAPAASGRTQHLTGSGETPDGLAASDWASIHSAYEAGQHAVQPADDGGHRARNPGQQWRTRFDGRGFLIEPDAAAWRWGLELSAYGFPGHERALAPSVVAPEVDADGSRLAYAWDAGLSEWFVNDARGLEHGFTVNERPAGFDNPQSNIRNPQLSFTLAVRGTLRPVVERDGSGVRFVDARNATVVNYAGLKVWDADGKVLPARFEPLITHHSSLITLSVDERDARYPLTVDPIAQQAYLKPAAVGTTQAGDWLGFSVAVSGDTVVVGAPLEDSSTTGINTTPNESASNSGAAYVFTRSAGVWTQQAYLKPAAIGASQAFDNFGFSVAVSGNTIVVGAPLEDSDTTGVNTTPNESGSGSGASYVFTRSAGVWTQQAYLKPVAFGTQVNDQFGYSVAVSGDTIVVGALFEDSNTTGVNTTPNESAADSGAAFVFTGSAGVWTQQAYLKPAAVGTTQDGDLFGYSVAVSGDTVVVGARLEASNTTGVNTTPNESSPNSGAAYVFTRSAGVWTQQAYLKPAAIGATQANDQFGYSVAVSGDTVVVGAPFEDSNTTGVNTTPDESAFESGAAYVFTRSAGVWTQQANLKPTAVGATQANDQFGALVAVSGDTVGVGARLEDSNTTGVNTTPNESASNSGAAYVFTRSSGAWTEQAYLKLAAVGTTQANDQFGWSVAVSGDTVVVGAYAEDSNTTGVDTTPNESASDSGAAYVFTGLGVPAQFVVNSPVDAVDANTADGICETATPGQCTLRAAIQQANATVNIGGEPDHISFAIGTGQQTITVNFSGPGQLPTITEAVTIDATTQPGFSGTPLIVLTSNLALSGDGLSFQHSTGTSAVRGLVINNFNNGIYILTSGSGLVRVAGNYIGTDAAGTAAVRNQNGVQIIGAPNNLIGGTTSADRNVISGNSQYGVYISGSGAINNTVNGNYIGTNAAGSSAVGNFHGVLINSAGANNVVGGTTTGDRNVISGNRDVGVFMATGGSNNTVKGNYIGTDAVGTAAVGNQTGVGVVNSLNNIIGGTTAADRNVISGNTLYGVLISGTGTNTTLKGNYLGTDASGTAPLGNLNNGVYIESSSNNVIGGVGAGEANTIANSFKGVRVVGAASLGNMIRGNSIFANTSMGLDLNDNGVTANDAGDADTGANNLQNYPTLTYDPTFRVVVATLNSTATTTFNIDFYSNTANERQGRIYRGTRQLTTDGSGNGSVSATFAQEVPAGQYITASATRTTAPLDTSEFAAQLLLASPTAATATISGRISNPEGAGVAGAIVSLTGSQTRRTITDGSGSYRFDSVETNGFYTVTPSRANYSFGPASRSFGQLGNSTEAAFTGTPDAVTVGNSIDTAEYFVRQHYLDFLGREPDESGLNFWSDQILGCGNDFNCIERRTINVSAAYFLSIEFQETGGLVDGLYRASYGRAPLFSEFGPDTATVAHDVIVGDAGWQDKLAANKLEFLDAWVQRPGFRAAYDSLSNANYIDALIGHTRADFTMEEGAALLSDLNNNTLTRAAVLQLVAQNERFVKAKFNEAFVRMQYFGYLRRDPDDSGFHFWLDKLNEFEGNFERAEMVKAFINSGEYRARFQR